MKKETKIFYDKVNFINHQISSIVRYVMLEIDNKDIGLLWMDCEERFDEISSCIGTLTPTTQAQINRKKALHGRLLDTKSEVLDVLSIIEERKNAKC